MNRVELSARLKRIEDEALRRDMNCQWLWRLFGAASVILRRPSSQASAVAHARWLIEEIEAGLENTNNTKTKT